MLYVKIGDQVTRLISSDNIPQVMTVCNVDNKFIYCSGGWKFCKRTGAEIDEALGWMGVPDKHGIIHTGSMIVIDGD